MLKLPYIPSQVSGCDVGNGKHGQLSYAIVPLTVLIISKGEDSGSVVEIQQNKVHTQSSPITFVSFF